MKHAEVYSIAHAGGLKTEKISVEVSMKRGLPGMHIGGVQGAGREMAERVRVALLASRVNLPLGSISVNLSPVDLPKKGSGFDLAVASALILALYGRDPGLLRNLPLRRTLFLGELSLSGRVLPVSRILPLVLGARRSGFTDLVMSRGDLENLRAINGLRFHPLEHLQDLLDHPPDPVFSSPLPTPSGAISEQTGRTLEILRLSPDAWKAIQVSLAGWHSILFIGPPGTGKSTVARSMGDLLPPLSPGEALENLALNQLTGEISDPGNLNRPVRSPHHSVTPRALVGGGLPPEPGEVTRAHNGLLILDEYAEFSRSALQSLREPMQDQKVTISRGGRYAEYPARFLLAATTNPCPCGHLNDPDQRCICTGARIQAYRQRIMGPLQDRIQIEVRMEKGETAISVPGGITGFLESMERARKIQAERYSYSQNLWNGDLKAGDLERWLPLEKEALEYWKELQGMKRFSPRNLAGIRRLARTLGDLAGAVRIRAVDLVEASRFRILDEYWNESSSS